MVPGRPALGIALAVLLSGCAYHPPPGGPWLAEERIADCSGIDGTYDNEGAFGQLTQDAFWTPILANELGFKFAVPAGGIEAQSVRFVSAPDGMRIGALQNGVETASLHVAPETLRCTDGWLTISDQLEFVGDPRRTDNDEEIISVRVTRDGALILRKIYTVFPGDKVLTSYERFRRLH